MKLSLIVPVFNEEQAVGVFYQAVRQEPSLQAHSVEIVFINDGSTDRTGEYAQAIALADKDVIKALPEQQLFMKGVLSWAGFNVVIIEYDRAPRRVGQSKLRGWALWNLALEGITSFSTLPLRLWSYVGGAIALMALLYAGYMAIDKILFGNSVLGYPSLMTAILFLGGMQLIGIGMLGEYVGRIYMEAKHRPRYVIKNRVVQKNNEEPDRP